MESAGVRYNPGTDLGILEGGGSTLPGPNRDGIVWLMVKSGRRKSVALAFVRRRRCVNTAGYPLMVRRSPSITRRVKSARYTIA